MEIFCKRRRKAVLILIMTVIINMISGGCSYSGKGPLSSDKLKIVTTIFPEYDWTRNILGERLSDTDLILLMDNGVDLHSYQATAGDIMNISSCDVLIYVGGESDEWIGDALKEAVNKDMTIINLLDVLGDRVKNEEIKEGMEVRSREEDEADEHVWLSLRNTAIICDAIAAALAEKDPENGDLYMRNAEKYKDSLSGLDKEYEEAVRSGEKDTLLFGDRFPFRYMVDDYGLKYYAAFSGCSAETEAAFETVIFLSDKTDELGLNAIMITEGSDGEIARTVRDNTGTKDQKIMILDSLQSVTEDDMEAGTTYLSVMTENLSVLKEALQ